MGLTIKTTGLEQYAPGGAARVQALIIGGPGAGKTRSSSFWPKPFYADCESGLASIADRQMPYADIHTSQDMLDLLAFMKTECAKPEAERRWHTLVIDTLDAFQRKVKDEWLQLNPNAGSFRGFDAWGYLDSKMSMLMTRLLNLDMNVVVNVHFKDKTIKEGSGENASERQEYMLQLQGDVKDNAFNDFDLVGWMGSYYEAVNGERVKKRGVTFHDTPDKWFLKDRFHITPKWLPITFTEQDYLQIFEPLSERLAGMVAGAEIGEIPGASGFDSAPTSGVVAPGSSGPLPPQDPRDVPLPQHDKPTLTKMARELATKLGLEPPKIKSNTIKAEVIAIIEDLRKQEAEAAEKVDVAPAAGPVGPQGTVGNEGATGPEPVATPATAPEPDPAPSTDVQTAPVVETPAEESSESVESLAEGFVQTDEGVVNESTGEITEAEAVATVVEGLGAEVVSSEPTAEVNEAPAPPKPPVTAAPASTGVSGVCAEEGCGKDLAKENANFVRLSFIKFKKHMCEEHYKAAKKG